MCEKRCNIWVNDNHPFGEAPNGTTSKQRSNCSTYFRWKWTAHPQIFPAHSSLGLREAPSPHLAPPTGPLSGLI